MVSLWLQWSLFLAVCISIFVLSFLGICRAFSRSFMHFSISQVESVQLLPIFRESLSISPIRVIKHGLRMRAAGWPLLVIIVLAAVSFAAVYGDPEGYFLQGLLPHWYSVLRNNLLEGKDLLATSAMMMTLYLLIRLPRQTFSVQTPVLQPLESKLSMIISFYYQFRKLYLDEIVFLGHRADRVADFAIYVERSWFNTKSRLVEEWDDALEHMRKSSGQPKCKESTDHEILFGYLERVGAPKLITELTTRLDKCRVELRHGVKVEVELEDSESKDTFTAITKRVGCIHYNCVRSLDIADQGKDIPSGNYRLQRFDSKKLKRRQNIVQVNSRGGTKYISLSPCRDLGNCVRRAIA